MANGKFIAYYRVSTDKQGHSGLGLEAQRVAVTDYLNGGKWELVEEFTEIESGKRNDRPALAVALAACRKHKATLIIAKLDRLARNVAFIANLMEGKVDFVAADFPTANRLTIHILAAVAEYEREMISKRTKAALAILKAQGVKLGNRTNLAEARAIGLATNKRKANADAANVLPIIDEITATGCTTLRAISAALNARGVRTARGGAWHASTLRNVLARRAAA